MDLTTNYPYWLLKEGIIRTYPALLSNISTDVVIMGGGISGALTAWYICQAGMEAVVVDKGHIGMGSTAASTSLLQYEIDTPLVELISRMGMDKAFRSYQLGVQAIADLEEICHKLSDETSFKKRPSFQYASALKDLPGLKEEYAARKKAGIKLHWLDQKDIKEKFGFQKKGGLLSQAGAEVNAYALSHALLGNCKRKGLCIYEKTEIKEIGHKKKGIELITTGGKKIKAAQLIIACGYESQKYLSHQIEILKSTYAIISEPFSKSDLWYKHSLIWETADPYLYLRTTLENRILIGGKDDDFSAGYKRKDVLPRKIKELEKSFHQLFPHLVFKTDFNWAGVFASTKDGLPYIGQIRQRPNTYFALGFGGNGIVFSILAAQIIRDLIQGIPNPDAAIFKFDR